MAGRSCYMKPQNNHPAGALPVTGIEPDFWALSDEGAPHYLKVIGWSSCPEELKKPELSWGPKIK